MTSRILDRLATARRQRFVGRVAELALFQAALDAPECAEPAFAVLYLHGPGGVGKTTLLQMYADLAEQAGRVVLQIDARDLQLTPDELLDALAQRLDTERGTMEEIVARWPASGVLVIDSYEPDASLDDWLRDVLLPSLPARTLALLAGRKPPASQWTTDIAWAPLTRLVALRNLDADESGRYLEMRGVALSQRAGILAATHGHALALSLAADATLGNPGAQFNMCEQPNMVRMLLDRLLDEVPSPRHRLALHTCATARLLTEPMLAAALAPQHYRSDARAEAHVLFEWLGGLACIESSPQGLSPHDLAREVLYADARRSNIDSRRAINAGLLSHLYERFQSAQGAQRQRIWFDILYVQRNNTGMRRYFAWSAAGKTFAAPLRGRDDVDAVRAMTLRQEGIESARIVEHWLSRQPDAFQGFFDLRGQLVGYEANLRLDAATEEDRRIDPGTDRALAFIEKRAPARAGEEIVYVRFWMAAEGHQSNPATMTVLAANASLYWTTHPKLAWSLCAVADADHFEPMFSGIQMHRAREADFDLASRHWGVFAHDWRAETVAQWLMMKVERASQDEPPFDQAPSAAPLLVLSEAEFAEAVQRALRDFARADALAGNPLLRTRLLAQYTEHGERAPDVEALRALLRQASGSLNMPKDRKSLAALHHTYFEPSTTQEQAAERLGVPFNTYRYQLTRGTQRVVQWLWARELGST